jgi:hypothetical protein
MHSGRQRVQVIRKALALKDHATERTQRQERDAEHSGRHLSRHDQRYKGGGRD